MDSKYEEKKYYHNGFYILKSRIWISTSMGEISEEWKWNKRQFRNDSSWEERTEGWQSSDHEDSNQNGRFHLEGAHFLVETFQLRFKCSRFFVLCCLLWECQVDFLRFIEFLLLILDAVFECFISFFTVHDQPSHN